MTALNTFVTNFGATAANNNRCTISIAGIDYAVVSLSINYAINEIPAAQVTIPLGKNVSTKKRSSATAILAGVSLLTPAKVFLQMTGTKPSGGTWPTKPVAIFDGYVEGTSYSRARGRLLLVVQLLHWSVGLTFASAVSAGIHPASPADMFVPISVTSPGGPSGERTTATFLQAAVGAVPAIGADTDITDAIKTILTKVTGQTPLMPVCGSPAADPPNYQAVMAAATAALDRLLVSTSVVAGIPAVTLQPGVLNSVTTQSLRTMLGALDDNHLMSQTLWDMLINYYCAQLGLETWITEDFMYVVPSLPGWRAKPPWRVLTSNDVMYLDTSAVLPKPLQGVVAYGHGIALTGAVEATSGTDAVAPCAAGSYMPPNAQGSLLYVALPPWVTFGSEVQTNNLTTPQTSSTDPAVAAVAPAANSLASVCAAWAQHVFAQNMLRGRSGVLATPLRFDIAPGSQLQITLTDTNTTDSTPVTFFAQVNRLTIELDSNPQSPRATSSFGLAAIRTDIENGNDTTSTAAHPLYASGLRPGAPVIAALA